MREAGREEGRERSQGDKEREQIEINRSSGEAYDESLEGYGGERK